MSFIKRLFRVKKEAKGPTAGEVIQKLREMEEILIQKQKRLESNIEIEIDRAKKNAVHNKAIAIKALKYKQRYSKHLEQINGILGKIALQRDALEEANKNTAVLTAMKDAADALKKNHKNVDIDQVHHMMDEIAKQQDLSKEIWDAMSYAVEFDVSFDVDQDELEKELDELLQKLLDDDVLKVSPENLPTDSRGEIIKPRPTPTKTVVDDQDIKELEAWL